MEILFYPCKYTKYGSAIVSAEVMGSPSLHGDALITSFIDDLFVVVSTWFTADKLLLQSGTSLPRRLIKPDVTLSMT